MQNYSLALFVFINMICFGQKKEMGNSDPSITTCVLVEKAFVKKDGKVTDRREIYLSCSIQDYFIKFCESEVTEDELAKFIGDKVSVVMEIREGDWDICEDDAVQIQSRIGNYVVIHSIENH